MISEILAITFFLVSLLLFYSLRQRKIQQKEWIAQLKQFHAGDHERFFSKQDGDTAEIAFELNRIVGENQEEIQLNKKTDQANRMLLTSLSHDVRTPLASLLGYLEALDKGSLENEEEKEYISVAHRKATDLKVYIDNLFDWFKLNSLEQQYQFEFVDINEFTREILIAWLPVLEQADIELSVVIPESITVVAVDRFAYSRILNNLIQNAIQHGACTRISIILEEMGDGVRIDIGNNGKSIPTDQLPLIFERLYKGDAARADRGSGLGLAIVNELVKGLGGQISVPRSDESETIFSISFPCKK